jgi:hypothetical protein
LVLVGQVDFQLLERQSQVRQGVIVFLQLLHLLEEVVQQEMVLVQWLDWLVDQAEAVLQILTPLVVLVQLIKGMLDSKVQVDLTVGEVEGHQKLEEQMVMDKVVTDKLQQFLVLQW